MNSSAINIDVPRRKEQKEATRKALRRAALSCFESAGYAGTQISHITEKAGVAKGTFYVHFADKDALLESVLEEFNDGFITVLRSVWSPDAMRDPARLTRTIAELFLDYWTAHRGFIRAYSEKTAAVASLEALQFGLNPPMRNLLTQTLASLNRSFSPARLELVIQGILAMWLRLGLQALFNPQAQRNLVIDTLVDLTTGALTSAIPQLSSSRAQENS